MREFHDLSNYYPPYANFGGYTITTTQPNEIVARNLLDFYNKEIYIKPYDNVLILKHSERGYIVDTGAFLYLTYQNFINNANGDILIFGLGLGFIIFPLLLDPTITSIKVVEYDQELIDYVGVIIKNQDINNKLTIVNGDYRTYYQTNTDETYDYVYIDCWSYLDVSAYQQMDDAIINYSEFKKTNESIITTYGQDIRGLISL